MGDFEGNKEQLGVGTQSLVWPVHIEFLLITYLLARMGFPPLEMLKIQLAKLQSKVMNFKLVLLFVECP